MKLIQHTNGIVVDIIDVNEVLFDRCGVRRINTFTDSTGTITT